MEEGFSCLLSVLQIEAHESQGSQWSHSSRAFSLFFFCKMKGGKQEEVFLSLHFLSPLKHPQRAGLGACIKHVAMPQPQAPLLLWLCKLSLVEWESLQNWEPGSCHPLIKVPWLSPHCGVCFQLEVNRRPFSVPVSGVLVTSHCPWLSCF